MLPELKIYTPPATDSKILNSEENRAKRVINFAFLLVKIPDKTLEMKNNSAGTSIVIANNFIDLEFVLFLIKYSREQNKGF
jgi:hypothetical protein